MLHWPPSTPCDPRMLYQKCAFKRAKCAQRPVLKALGQLHPAITWCAGCRSNTAVETDEGVGRVNASVASWVFWSCGLFYQKFSFQVTGRGQRSSWHSIMSFGPLPAPPSSSKSTTVPDLWVSGNSGEKAGTALWCLWEEGRLLWLISPCQKGCFYRGHVNVAPVESSSS